jgi:hypothetical protein
MPKEMSCVKDIGYLQNWMVKTPGSHTICWLRRPQEESGQTHPAAYQHVGSLKNVKIGGLGYKAI